MFQNNFCIVGYGKHAKNKIIPQLLKEKKIINGIITKKKISSFKIFKNIDEAILKIDKKNTFILCSPPHIHADQAIKILKSGFNVIIEKPVTTKINDLKKIIKISNKQKLFFVESMMFQYSKSFKNFLEIFNKKKKKIKKIVLNFIIPSYENQTFRSENQKYSVNLFDIGCYPVSLINSLFKNIKLKIIKIKNLNILKKEIIYITNVNNKNVEIIIKIGLGLKYKNEIILQLDKETIYKFHPFFYGREGIRYLETKIRKYNKTYKFIEKNSFSNLLNVKTKVWNKTQRSRNKLMLKNLSSLENLNNQYNKLVRKKNDIQIFNFNR